MAAPNPWKVWSTKVIGEKSKLLNRLYIDYKMDPKPNEKTKKGTYTKDAINAAMKDRMEIMTTCTKPEFCDNTLRYSPRIVYYSNKFKTIVVKTLCISKVQYLDTKYEQDLRERNFIVPVPVEINLRGENTDLEIWPSDHNKIVLINSKNHKPYKVFLISISNGDTTELNKPWWAEKHIGSYAIKPNGIYQVIASSGWEMHMGGVEDTKPSAVITVNANAMPTSTAPTTFYAMVSLFDSMLSLMTQSRTKEEMNHDFKSSTELVLCRTNFISDETLLFELKSNVVTYYDPRMENIYALRVHTGEINKTCIKPNITSFGLNGHVFYTNGRTLQKSKSIYGVVLHSAPQFPQIISHYIVHNDFGDFENATASDGYIMAFRRMEKGRRRTIWSSSKLTQIYDTSDRNGNSHTFIPPTTDEIKQVARWLSQQTNREIFPQVIWNVIAEWLTDV
jgi:hypothetical protein